MTAPPEVVLDEIWRHRERRNSICKGALLTSVFVAVGFIVASMTLSPARAPSEVAKAYADARFARDWSGAWDLLCQPARAANGGYQAYADSAAETLRFMPIDVDVSTGRMERIYGSAVAIPVTVTSPEPLYKDWEAHSHVVLVLEDGKFRVCDDSLLPG
jgi:hypothetical protein